MMDVLISYRRDDDPHAVDRLFGALREALAPRQVFLDIDNIPIGIDYEEHLKQQVSTCHALLVVIGPRWLEVRDDSGKRRLDNAEDFVHIEIQTALDRKIPVVPVLLDTTMPKAEQLPEALKPIVKRQYWEITRKRFQTDVDGLARRLRDVLNGAQPATPLAPTVSRSAIKVDVGTASCDFAMPGQCETRFLLPGAGKTEWFKDLDVGPEMVVVPAGSFTMGSPENEPERDEPKGSAGKEEQHRVTISEPFAVGRFTVTRGEFAAFVRATDHQTSDEAFVVKNDNYQFSKGYSWRNPGFAQDDSHPVVCINWHDAKAYAAWLAAATGKLYRLLSEAEWEYICRAGTTTTFWWGPAISSSEANYNASYIYAGGGKKGEWRKRTLPVESFPANPWGLFQLHGNVWEQCEDWWNESTVGAPVDGSAWIAGDCNRRVLRGGSWFNYPWSLRSAHRHGCYITGRVSGFGFRVARTLTT
jgi:formylglycine-generating enzyme required for sulfatase activity